MNLNSNSFVFIDDRADERAIVSSVYPEIVSLDANEPANLASPRAVGKNAQQHYRN